YRTARERFARRRPRAVLFSVATEPAQKALCAAADAAGIPVIFSRHGEAGMRGAPILAYTDPDVASWALCWGEFEDGWYQRHAKRPLNRRITGAPMIEGSVAEARPRAIAR